MGSSYQNKTKSNPLVNQKLRCITKFVVSFYSLSMSLKGAFAPKELPTLKHGAKIEITNHQAEMISLACKSIVIVMYKVGQFSKGGIPIKAFSLFQGNP